MAKNASVVLDLGCNKVKFGFAGESRPRVQTRSYYSVSQHFLGPEADNSVSEDFPVRPKQTSIQKYKFGEELKSDNPNSVYRPIFDVDSGDESGYLKKHPSINTELLCKLYNLELCPSLNVSTYSMPLLVAEPNSDCKSFRESLL